MATPSCLIGALLMAFNFHNPLEFFHCATSRPLHQAKDVVGNVGPSQEPSLADFLVRRLQPQLGSLVGSRIGLGRSSRSRGLSAAFSAMSVRATQPPQQQFGCRWVCMLILMAGMFILVGIGVVGSWVWSKLYPIEPKPDYENMMMITTPLAMAVGWFGKWVLSRAPAQAADIGSESDASEPQGGLPSVSGEQEAIARAGQTQLIPPQGGLPSVRREQEAIARAGQIQLIPRRRPGPPCPKCAHVQVVRANGLTGEEFWSCPRFPTCTGKVRVKDYPIYDMVVETLAPVTPAETCQHLRTWKKGSNGSKRRVQCKDCGHVILWEHI